MTRSRDQRGFTLPEVMAASLILMVGILGTATVGDVANQLSVKADQRAGANSVARRVSEAARSLTSTQIDSANLIAQLKASAPVLLDTTPADEAWTVDQRGATYTVGASVCTVDGPSDGFGQTTARDSSYCAQPAATVPADLQPNDYRRVTISVSIKGRAIVRQVTNSPSGETSSLPLITDLRMRQGTASCTNSCLAITSPAETSATFDATTVNDPARIDWQVDGRAIASCPGVAGACTGGANAWSFRWALGAVQTDPRSGFCVPGNYTLDGVYQVGLQALDRVGATGGAATLSIAVNRCAGGLAPPGLVVTGRDRDGHVDVEWQDNAEGDIVGYRVYRGSASARVPVCPPDPDLGKVISLEAANECLDTTAPAYTQTAFEYGVYAVDRDASGTFREGAVAAGNVNTGNRAPLPVMGLGAARDAAGDVTLTWTIPASEDPDQGDRIESFRVYRRASGIAGSPGLGDRFDRELATALCSGSTCRWTDREGSPSPQAYWLTSLDTHLRESPFAGGVTA